MLSATMVARPVGVNPSRTARSAGDQPKWSAQESVRGLKRGTLVFVTGSMLTVRDDLARLQGAHAKARLLIASIPPLEAGLMCSR